jgi:hypothetical protein
MEKKERPVLTTVDGAPIGVQQALTGAPRGPVLTQDVQFIEQMQHFNREWISEPPVHIRAKMPTSAKSTAERRRHRRHDMETQDLVVDRWDWGRRSGKNFGRIMDLSAGGVRIRTSQENIQPGNQIRVCLELPASAGISPFMQAREKGLTPMNEWVGWMTVKRVAKINKDECDVAGRLIDMDEIDRGMLGLYLSTLPLAVCRQ